jgi:hypothetical protein
MEIPKSKPAQQPESYKKLKTLGSGTFGTAYLVECKNAKQLAVIK